MGTHDDDGSIGRSGAIARWTSRSQVFFLEWDKKRSSPLVGLLLFLLRDSRLQVKQKWEQNIGIAIVKCVHEHAGNQVALPDVEQCHHYRPHTDLDGSSQPVSGEMCQSKADKGDDGSPPDISGKHANAFNDVAAKQHFLTKTGGQWNGNAQQQGNAGEGGYIDRTQFEKLHQ